MTAKLSASGEITRTRAASGSRGPSVTSTASAARTRPAVSTSDDPARDGVRLGVIAFTTAASVVGLTALGAIAAHVGVDAWLGAGPGARSFGELFVTGVRLPLAMLRALYASGVDDPVFFGAAMALLIPPIAALAAARPIRPGGPRASAAVINAGRLGAVLVVAGSIGIAIRLFNLDRPTLAETASDAAWLDHLRSLAASDAVSMALAILLAVLIFRLPVDRWVRALGGTLAIGTAVAAAVSAAASNGIVDEVERPHPILASKSTTVLNDADAPDHRLLLGAARDGLRLTLGADIAAPVVLEPPTPAAVVGHISIAAWRSVPSRRPLVPGQTEPDPRP